MSKSPDAFRTISEVAEWLDTQAHVLRFWESKFTQVKPVKRAGGRRYYRPSDMMLLGGIKKLLHDDGMTIKGAQKLLREKGVKYVASLSQPVDGEEPEPIEEIIADIVHVDTPEEPETAQVLAFQRTEEPEAPAADDPQTQLTLEATDPEEAPAPVEDTVVEDQPESPAPEADTAEQPADSETEIDSPSEPEETVAAADEADLRTEPGPSLLSDLCRSTGIAPENREDVAALLARIEALRSQIAQSANH
jgi:DNA-binding transcriptional MerR regulator